MQETIQKNLDHIKGIIKETAARAGRDAGSVKLVIVSKTFPADVVKKAIISGAHILGENYIQEARDKIEILSPHPVSWHFIGKLQSNKAKYAVRLFDLIHTVDSIKLAKEIDKQAAKIDKIQDILIQVNISGEATKSGTTPDAAFDLTSEITALPNIRVKGFMTMPPFYDEPEKARPYFKALRQLKDDITIRINMVNKDIADEITELSMGMSGDFKEAIYEGASLVRVGTAVFGRRS